jgi:hypothetical protein
MKPLAAMALACAFMIPAPALEAEFGAAGVPRELAAARDYQAIYRHLAGNGISLFFPTFQYQEAPEALSFGYESDFTAPCDPVAPAFSALRGSGVRLIIPGELLYPYDRPMPPLARDPLAQLIRCAGRENIYGVTNYDEPVLTGKPIGAVKQLYERVKAVDAAMPVLMVHAPVVTDQEPFANADRIAAYFSTVAQYSAHADIAGFDVYPVPFEIAKLATPASGGKIAGLPRVLADYLDWMKANLASKRHLIVLQGFAMPDLYAPDYLRTIVSEEQLREIKAPTREETAAMAAAAEAAGVELIVWWGQGALKSLSQPPWPDVLSVARQRR